MATQHSNGNGRSVALVRTALYLRASSAEQTESIGAQRMLLERYASDHNLEIVSEHSDFAITGDSCRSRDGLQDLLADAKAGKFEAVLVRNLSRLSRRDSLKSAATIVGPLLDAGITIYTATHGNLQLDSATGRIMLAVLSEFDHAENVSRSFNVLNGQLKAATGGSWIGMAPYAYRVEGEKHHKRLVIADEAKAAVVRRVFEMYASGESCRGIARTLNADKVSSPSGGKWIPDTIRDILDRPVYVGDHRFNHYSSGKYYALNNGKPVERRSHWVDDERERPKQTINDAEDWICIPDHWPAIVSRELWNRVQRRLEHNSQSKPATTDKTFVLTGLLRCKCGCTRDMYGKFRSGKKRYQCSDCQGWVIESEVLEAIGRTVQRCLAPEILERLERELIKQTAKPKKRGPSVKSLEQQLEKQNRKLVVLDADLLGPVQQEIRRLKREIEQSKRATQQTAQNGQGGIVKKALANLFRLPEVLRDANERLLKVNLADMLDTVLVEPASKGKGTGRRWNLASGAIALTCHHAGGGETPHARRHVEIPLVMDVRKAG